MSKLADKIQAAPIEGAPVRRGPANTCGPLYGPGDLEDWEAVEALRRGSDATPALTWREVHEHVDRALGIQKRITLEKFRYHFRRRCFCWPEDLRR